MVISHQYRYVFVELPRTGSTAVSKELQLHYDGTRILRKHSTYTDFLRRSTPEEARYFVFAGMRNPMDKLVSLYFKYKYDHRDYANPRTYKGSNPWIRLLMQRQFRFVHDEGATFAQFFRRFYYLPYNDWSSLDHHRMDHIIRFESLSEDFAVVLRRLGIVPARPLPLHNKTKERSDDFWSYFTPEVRERARWVFAPYFKRWGYAFPADWDQSTPRGSQLAFNLTDVARRVYWRYLR